MFPTAPPAEGTPFGIYWPTTVSAELVTQTVTLDDGAGEPVVVATVPSGTSVGPEDPGIVAVPAPSDVVFMDSELLPIGAVYGARSGDKGGNANIGVWAPLTGRAEVDEARWIVLRRLVGDAERVSLWLPEADGLDIDVHLLPNLHAVNVVIHGLLGRGVADSTSLDPQAKGLAEQLRARVVYIATDALLPGDGEA
jgi:hypothetical protein